MNPIRRIQKKVSLIVAALFFSIVCEGSRPKQIIDTYRDTYKDYQETGDPTWLIILIILTLLVVALWILKRKKND